MNLVYQLLNSRFILIIIFFFWMFPPSLNIFGIFNFNIYFVDKAPHEIPGKMMYMSTDLENTTTDVTLINNIWGKSKFGLPNWSEELNQILEETSNLKSEIFYSGPLKYRKTIESIAKKENITFHKKAF